MVRIDKIHEGCYLGEADPPHAVTRYRSPEILPAQTLAQEIAKRGVSQSEIDAAFAEADRYWIPRGPWW
jgi:hypothetical protein